MQSHVELERAEAYALGALDAAESSAFESHLASGCAACEAAVRQGAALLAALPQALPQPAPAEGLRAQLLDLAQAPRELPDLATLEWEEVVPGVRMHALRQDAARGMRAYLAWGEPGARTLAHRHAGGDELILVLQGGLRDERGEYHAGDVCRSREGSVHTEEILPGEDCIAYVVYYGEPETVAE